MNKESFNRLIGSRKLWGGLIGSISIIVVLLIGGADVTTAIGALGALWGLAIGGQAAHDYVKGKRNNGDANA